MTFTYSDIVITVVIIAVVLYAAHRLGQVNPIGTGKLSQRLTAVEATVAQQGLKLDAVSDALEVLAKSSAAEAKDIAAMRMELAGDRGLGERTWAAVERMEGFFIQQAIEQRVRP